MAQQKRQVWNPFAVTDELTALSATKIGAASAVLRAHPILFPQANTETYYPPVFSHTVYKTNPFFDSESCEVFDSNEKVENEDDEDEDEDEEVEDDEKHSPTYMRRLVDARALAMAAEREFSLMLSADTAEAQADSLRHDALVQQREMAFEARELKKTERLKSLSSVSITDLTSMSTSLPLHTPNMLTSTSDVSFNPARPLSRVETLHKPFIRDYQAICPIPPVYAVDPVADPDLDIHELNIMNARLAGLIRSVVIPSPEDAEYDSDLDGHTTTIAVQYRRSRKIIFTPPLKVLNLPGVKEAQECPLVTLDKTDDTSWVLVQGATRLVQQLGYLPELRLAALQEVGTTTGVRGGAGVQEGAGTISQSEIEARVDDIFTRYQGKLEQVVARLRVLQSGWNEEGAMGRVREANTRIANARQEGYLRQQRVANERRAKIAQHLNMDENSPLENNFEILSKTGLLRTSATGESLLPKSDNTGVSSTQTTKTPSRPKNGSTNPFGILQPLRTRAPPPPPTQVVIVSPGPNVDALTPAGTPLVLVSNMLTWVSAGVPDNSTGVVISTPIQFTDYQIDAIDAGKGAAHVRRSYAEGLWLQKQLELVCHHSLLCRITNLYYDVTNDHYSLL